MCQATADPARRVYRSFKPRAIGGARVRGSIRKTTLNDGRQRSAMNRVVEIVGRIFAGAIVFAGAVMPLFAGPAGSDETMPDRSGPWAFTTRMATTPAAEDTDV